MRTSRAAAIATACVLVAALLTAAPAAADAVRWSHLDGRDSGKIASGLSSSVTGSNLKRTSNLGGKSWWRNDSSWNRYSYVENNPLKYTDPTGEILDTILDVGFIIYDVGVIVKDNIIGGTTEGLGTNLAALGGDVVGAVVPFATGGGAAVRGGVKLANRADNLVDGARAAENAGDAGKTFQTYTKTNADTMQVYSGRTSGTGTPQQNVARRDAGHHMNDQGYGPAQLDRSSANPDAIRGREQQLIDASGGAQSQGGTSGNRINGVSSSNAKAPGYTNAAEREFGGS